VSSVIDNKASLIWSIADKLQGDYKPHEYGDVILPFTVLKRFDSVLADTKQSVLKAASQHQTITPPIDKLLKSKAKQEIYNISKFDFKSLLDDPDNIEANFRSYVGGFCDDVKDILSKERGFEFDRQIDRLANAGLLYLIIQEFCTEKADLHPDKITNIEMGYIFEEIIRKFSETYNADAGEFYTPREIIHLMVDLLLENEDLSEDNKVKQIYDGACGTGGMLSIAYEEIKKINSTNEIFTSGQEINPHTYAICKSDMLLKGGKNSSIKFGSTLSKDQFSGETFDYIIMNPPFGREWQIGRIKNVIKNSGSGTTPESGNTLYYDNGNHYWIQSGDLYNTTYIVDTKKKISDLAVQECKSLQIYEKDFLIIAMYGASIGNVAISKISAYVNQACYCLKPNRGTDLKFLYYCLEANKQNLIENSFGGTQPNINSETIRNQRIPIIPLAEQKEIVAYLDKRCKQIDQIITYRKAIIEKLEEYKKSLIYEAVTGKREI